MPRPHTILLADDEAHIRLMLATLAKEMGLEIVGEATNGVSAVQLFRETMPDLMLLDIHMPIKNGEFALREIMREFPEARVIMLTSISGMATVEECLRNGAFNFLRKDSPLEEIRIAILEALE